MGYQLDNLLKNRIEKRLENYTDEEAQNSLNSLKSFFSIEEEEIEKIYDEGNEHFEKGEYMEASQCFGSIAYLEPKRLDYWLLLAYSLMAAEKFKESFSVFSLIAEEEKEDPNPLFWAAKNKIYLEEKEEAKELLEECIKRAQEKHDYREIEEEARELLEKT